MALLSLSSMWHLPVPERLFIYADAYRNSSATLCQKMIDDPATFTWPHGSVVLMLGAHAVELFLKGALLKRDPGLDVWNHGHNIETLKDEYRSHFPESVFEWDIPFASELNTEDFIAKLIEWYPELTPEQARQEAGRSFPSIVYRYPVARGGKEWEGVYGFEAPSFSKLLDQLGEDFERIKSHLAS